MAYSNDLLNHIKRNEILLFSPVKTWIYGIVLAIILGGLTTIMLSFFIHKFLLIIFLSSSIAIGLLGKRSDLQPDYVAVVTFLGKRIRTWLLEEGTHYIPVLFNIIPVHITKDYTKIEQPIKSPTDFIDVQISAIIYWSVVAPYDYTTMRKIINENNSSTFEKEIQAKMRTEVIKLKLNAQDTITVNTDFEKAVARNLNASFNQNDQNWGIRVHEVSIHYTDFASKDISDAFLMKVKREVERSNEELDSISLANRILILMKDTGISGESAAEFIFQLKKKVLKRENSSTINVPNLDKALEAILQSFNRKP
jgi:hypothetical protein